jgi:hypothetical protein
MGLWDTAPSFNNPPNFNDLEEVKKYLKDNINKIARSFQDIDSIINGYISSANVREIAGYIVDQTDLASKDKAVGLSSKRDPDPTVDDLRIWAGDADRDQAAFRVYESGYVVLSKFLMQSLANAYPRVEMDSEGNLFKAYFNANTYVSITPDYGGAPAIEFWTGGTLRARFSTIFGDLEIYAPNGITLTSTPVIFNNWAAIYNQQESKTLQQELNEIYDRLEALEGP